MARGCKINEQSKRRVFIAGKEEETHVRPRGHPYVSTRAFGGWRLGVSVLMSRRQPCRKGGLKHPGPAHS